MSARDAGRPANTRGNATYQIRALERGLDILEAFSVAVPELSIGEIADRARLPKPTIVRLLSVLADRGYVERVPESERYRLGVRTLEVGSVFRQSTSLEAEAKPIMAVLADSTGQTANLGILDHFEVVHIEVVAPDRPVRFWASVGKREDAHVSGLGKVLLTALEPDARERYLARPHPSVTEHTIADAEALRAELVMTAEQGYATDREESNLGVYCIAAPIRDATGAIVAAISISGMRAEFEHGENPTRFVNEVRAAGDEISARLGWKVLAS